MHRFYKFYTLLLILSGQMLWAASFTSLQTGTDARSAAMGFTGSAFSQGATALHWNPALLAESPSTEAALSLNRWIQGVQTGAFAFSHAGFGLSLHYSQVGDIAYRIVPSELPIGTFSSTDAVIGIAFARRLSSRFSAGVKLNGYYEKIYLDEATGIGCDAGVVWLSPVRNLHLAAVIQHLGFTGKLRKESLVLPLTLRGGAAYQTAGPGGFWTGTIELVQIKDSNLHLHAGLEWTGYGLSLRAGYQSGYETRGFTAGLGFQRDRIGISYGYIPFQSSLGDAHILTVVFSW
jgi:hypothetical protein